MPNGIMCVYHKFKNDERDYREAILNMPVKGTFSMRAIFKDAVPPGAAELLKKYKIIRKASLAEQVTPRATQWRITPRHKELVEVILKIMKEEKKNEKKFKNIQ